MPNVLRRSLALFVLPMLLAACASLPAAPSNTASAPVGTGTGPASDEDIERLLDASRAQTLLANLLPQVDANQRQQFAQITSGKELSADQQAQLDSIQARTTDTLHKALSWDQVKPLYMDIYRQNFSREDVRAITKFYQSDAGQHMLDKNPLLVQGLMQAIQQKVTPTLTGLENELQQVVNPSSPAPPVSPPQKTRNEVIPESCHQVKVRLKGRKTVYRTECRTSTGGRVVKKQATTGKAAKSTKTAGKATTVKKKTAAASTTTTKNKAATTSTKKKPATKKKSP